MRDRDYSTKDIDRLMQGKQNNKNSIVANMQSSDLSEEQIDRMTLKLLMHGGYNKKEALAMIEDGRAEVYAGRLEDILAEMVEEDLFDYETLKQNIDYGSFADAFRSDHEVYEAEFGMNDGITVIINHYK